MRELADIRKIRCLGGNSQAKVAVTIQHDQFEHQAILI